MNCRHPAHGRRTVGAVTKGRRGFKAAGASRPPGRQGCRAARFRAPSCVVPATGCHRGDTRRQRSVAPDGGQTVTVAAWLEGGWRGPIPPRPPPPQPVADAAEAGWLHTRDSRRSPGERPASLGPSSAPKGVGRPRQLSRRCVWVPRSAGGNQYWAQLRGPLPGRARRARQPAFDQGAALLLVPPALWADHCQSAPPLLGGPGRGQGRGCSRDGAADQVRRRHHRRDQFGLAGGVSFGGGGGVRSASLAGVGRSARGRGGSLRWSRCRLIPMVLLAMADSFV